ncbi:7162_t:CDS:2 [Funneliformis mosseae]|uniref:7162_t:CDS:1 n=1 Tax=Funneliformis mosseae TaxID=27381 RepID=A0A9N9HWB7_FUNMO|nr:7162_t:CDS:2 [Funneliformis mosseae]
MIAVEVSIEELDDVNLFIVINKSQQRIIGNSNNGNGNNSGIDHGNNIDIMSVQNPVERRPKGRSKSKKVKSSLEQPSVKTQYKCKLCKQRDITARLVKNKNN